ncbi:MAG: ADP-ribosylation factor-like protein [Promethearchaeota archaeon]
MENAKSGQSKKIVFTGLDNSGKTSIILSLKENIAKVASLKPTISVNRTTFKFLDHEIVQHDLGGQKKYLIKYLKQPDKYFDTDVCIYVIDVLDISRYEESLSYFSDLLEQFLYLDIRPLIFVFLHKSELVILENDEKCQANIDLLKRRFAVINSEKGNFSIFFKITTIYDIWSISSSFSDILRRIYPPSALISKSLEKLANSLNAEAMALFDEHIITLANFLKDEKYKDAIQFSVPYFFTLVSSMSNVELADIHADKIAMQLEGYDFLFFEIKTKPKIYLYILGKQDTLPKLKDVDQIIADFPELFLSLGVSVDEIRKQE